MNMAQISTLLVTGILLAPGLIISIFLCCGKGAGLIAGYNTASAGEREKWDEKALCRGTGILLLTILACMELSILGAVLGVTPLIWAGIILLLISTACGLAYLNKGRRFKRRPLE